MHDGSLAAMPLAAALERLAEDGARRGRLVVSTSVEPAATGDHDPFVLGVVRELLTNVVKHAHATRAEIAISLEDEAVVVRVTDDGLGTTREDLARAARTGHLGHARLRRRLAALGGDVELSHAPGPCTTVTCILPLESLGAQRTLEDALRGERRWSAALVAAMQDGFVVFRDGRAAQVNDRMCAMTGFGHEELVDRPVEESPFWPREDRGELALLIAAAATAGGTEAQATLVRADGVRFPALIAARSVRDDDGRPAGLLVTVKDITALELAAERRRLEQELGAVVATTKRLQGLLDVARAVEDEAGLDALLREIARTVAEDLGWAVVINLYRPACDDFVVATGHGIPAEGGAILEGARYEWAVWTPLLDERYERRGAYLVPVEDPADEDDGVARWTPPVEAIDAPDAWQRGDELLVPFRHTDGHFLGIMSLDAPTSGRRPSDAGLDVLVAIAAHAGLAVQHAQTAIESARHAAALASLLHVSSQIAGTREIAPMLDVVARAISEALGFETVVVEVAGPQGLLPQASCLRSPAADVLPVQAWAPVAPESLAGLLAPAHMTDGCFLLGSDEAAVRMPAARRQLLGSRRNGRGWRAWNDHVILVPLYGAHAELVGAIWADDPDDRLLPSHARLQALNALANQATAAMLAADRFERLAAASDGDLLTHLGNRRAFLRELEREAARAERAGASSVLVLADVDDCDVTGVDADQDVETGRLREFAEAFETELRGNDRVFRIDGGLFAMLLTGGWEPPQTAAVSVRLAGRVRSLGGRAGGRVAFGTAVLGLEGEGADGALRRASASLLAARGNPARGAGPRQIARSSPRPGAAWPSGFVHAERRHGLGGT